LGSHFRIRASDEDVTLHLIYRAQSRIRGYPQNQWFPANRVALQFIPALPRRATRMAGSQGPIVDSIL
jgi:hypothetical protein